MIGSSIASSVEDGLDKMAKHARLVLVAIAAINFGGAALMWVAGGVSDVAGLAPQLVTMVPVTIGVVIYGLSLATSLLLEPARVMSMWGLLINASLVVLCINGITSARSYEDLKRKLGSGKG
jgi:hypothetical protein